MRVSKQFGSNIDCKSIILHGFGVNPAHKAFTSRVKYVNELINGRLTIQNSDNVFVVESNLHVVAFTNHLVHKFSHLGLL